MSINFFPRRREGGSAPSFLVVVVRLFPRIPDPPPLVSRIAEGEERMGISQGSGSMQQARPREVPPALSYPSDGIYRGTICRFSGRQVKFALNKSPNLFSITINLSGDDADEYRALIVKRRRATAAMGQWALKLPSRDTWLCSRHPGRAGAGRGRRDGVEEAGRRASLRRNRSILKTVIPSIL